MSAYDGSCLPGYQGRSGNDTEPMALPVEPDQRQTVQHQAHRRRPLDRQRRPVRGVLQAHHLLGVEVHHLHTPPRGVMGQDRPRVPVSPRAVEHLIGAASLAVPDQEDRQQPVLARLVVQGPDRLDLELRVQPIPALG